MARLICRSGGLKPGGATCDAFDQADRACLLDKGECTLQRTPVPDEQVKASEFITAPSVLSRIQIDLQQGMPNLLTTGMEKYKAVTAALAIMEKMSPYAEDEARTGYWENPKAMEHDMGMLGSLHAQICLLAARMEANAARAKEAVKLVKAEKYVRIKRNFTLGVRISERRVTDEEVKNLRIADHQYQDAQRVALDTREIADLVSTNRDSVLEYVNILKKRLESVSREYRVAGNLPG